MFCFDPLLAYRNRMAIFLRIFAIALIMFGIAFLLNFAGNAFLVIPDQLAKLREAESPLLFDETKVAVLREELAGIRALTKTFLIAGILILAAGIVQLRNNEISKKRETDVSHD